MTPHFFVSPSQVGTDEALLGDEDTRHLVTVLRARPGSPVTLADGSGTIWTAAYRGLSDGAAAVSLLEAAVLAPRRPAITVVHALPKQRKLDEVVQRLTEQGVDRIVPVHSERSEIELTPDKARKVEARWRAVALAAAKQSRRPRLLDVAEVGTWVEAFAGAETGVVAWEASDTGLRSVLDRITDPEQLTIGIGPEGGLSGAEVERSGLPHASLGADILRTQTAAVVAVAAVRYHYGLMEPR